MKNQTNKEKIDDATKACIIFLQHVFEEKELTKNEATIALQYIVLTFILQFSDDVRTAINVINDEDYGFIANMNKTLLNYMESQENDRKN